MSILNWALQNVTIAREPTENMEGVLRSCGSMQDIRKAASTQPLLQCEWHKSLKSTIELLNNRFERLSLKDQKIFTEEYAVNAKIIYI